MKEDRIYAIVRWNPGFDRQAFAEARAQGLFGQANATFDTVRKSLDGTRAVVWWRGTRPARVGSGLVIEQGTLGEVLAHIAANLSEWQSKTFTVTQPVAFRADVVDPEPKRFPWKKAAAWGAGIAAAAGGGYALLHYVV
jgi:hypothetical protein